MRSNCSSKAFLSFLIVVTSSLVISWSAPRLLRKVSKSIPFDLQRLWNVPIEREADILLLWFWCGFWSRPGRVRQAWPLTLCYKDQLSELWDCPKKPQRNVTKQITKQTFDQTDVTKQMTKQTFDRTDHQTDHMVVWVVDVCFPVGAYPGCFQQFASCAMLSVKGFLPRINRFQVSNW